MRLLGSLALGCALLLTACAKEEQKPAPPGSAEARGLYTDALAGEGRSAVIFDNGDIILADSPRLAGDLLAGRVCAVDRCDPSGTVPDMTITIPDRSIYSGHERQAGGACMRVTKNCMNGVLVP